MSYPEKRYLELAEKWMLGTITDKEKQELSDWYNEGFDNEVKLDRNLEGDRAELEQRIFSRIRQQTWPSANTKIKTISRYAVAAVAVILIAFAIVFFRYQSHEQVKLIAETPQPNDIAAPTSPRAVLTLSNGKQIYVDSAGNGSSLATIGNTEIRKTKNGEILYSSITKQPVAIEYNTLLVPRGGQVIHLTLSDGTKVWLNSESSLRFPVAFPPGQRNVEITGEAYFEVAKDPERKFIVKSGSFETEVLGTHFNVNTYADESAARITLLEGSVRVTRSGGASPVVLSPGQQAMVDSKITKTEISNLNAIVAWKDGMFVFDNVNIAAIMRQLARWYNFSIHYKGDLQDKHFTGSISRTESAAQVLHMLEMTDVIHFKIEGDKVTITP